MITLQGYHKVVTRLLTSLRQPCDKQVTQCGGGYNQLVTSTWMFALNQLLIQPRDKLATSMSWYKQGSGIDSCRFESRTEFFPSIIILLQCVSRVLWGGGACNYTMYLYFMWSRQNPIDFLNRRA